MTDMFGDWVPFRWIAACYAVMAATPHHTHQVLTKRRSRLVEFYRWMASQERVTMGGGYRGALASFGAEELGDGLA